MSSILKALEKAEESNSTKRVAGDSDFIRSRKSRPSWVMPGAVLGTAGLAVLVTFAVMGGFSRPAPSVKVPVVVAAPTPAPAPAVLAPVNTVIESPAVVPEQTPPGRSARALAVPDPKTSPVTSQKAGSKPDAKVTSQVNAKAVPVVNAKAVPVVNAKGTAPVNVKGTLSINAKVTPAVKSKIATLPAGKSHAAAVKVPAVPVQSAASQARVETAPAVAPVPAHPEPKVSGIAWQSNGESSFAVVNGRAVLQGSTVDGFKVLEIHQDAVKFSGSNGTFEVPLGGEEK
jgi:general secretion pathway protein B